MWVRTLFISRQNITHRSSHPILYNVHIIIASVRMSEHTVMWLRTLYTSRHIITHVGLCNMNEKQARRERRRR
jgi:hypothetical protein